MTSKQTNEYEEALEERIATYTRKIKNENGSQETKNELRFAIEALEIVKGQALKQSEKEGE